MSQFYNYDNLPIDYIPNNIKPKPVFKEVSIKTHSPQKLYNIRNQFIGYSWHYGDAFEYELNFHVDIKVPDDSIIYEKAEQAPLHTTKGRVGQKAYNTVDIVSYTCTAVIGAVSVWEQDSLFTYYDNGEKTITLTPDMTDSKIEIEIFNFRLESIHKTELPGANKITLSLLSDLSYNKFVKGIYYASVKVKTNTGEFTLEDNTMIHVN